DSRQTDMIHVPDLAKDLLEQISFEARDNEFIDSRSGISARLSISAFENLLSTAERRAVKNKEDKTLLRFGDFLGVIPAITGKIELVYEGEQEGSAFVAEQLIGDAVKTLFPKYFPKLEKLEKPNADNPYNDLVEWFFAESGFEILDDLTEKEYKKKLDSVPPLNDLIKKYQADSSKEDSYFLKEFLLWGLVEYKKLNKYRSAEGIQFKDLYGSYISGL
ncbi:MAG: magnesium chelatase, partial [Gillisia sp.]